MDILEKMQQANWKEGDARCQAWVAAHPNIENNVKDASNDDLAQSIMYCQNYENIFTHELLVRAGKLDAYLACKTAIEKSHVLSEVDNALNVIIF